MIGIGILGSTGAVGQKFIALLSKEREFFVQEVAASDVHVGKMYKTHCEWQDPLMPLPDDVACLKLKHPKDLRSRIIISCLPSSIAFDLESYYLDQGRYILSNTSAFRMHEHVPLIISEVNDDHVSLLEKQDFPGRIITNPNCCVAGIGLALAPLHRALPIDHVSIVTLQAMSGAGYRGLFAMDILGTTIPYIADEEEKIVRETLKILGNPVSPASFAITPSVHRVPVMYGHSISMHIAFQTKVQISDVYDIYAEAQHRFPDAYALHSHPDRPRASCDLLHDDMRVHIGPATMGGSYRHIKINILVHNLVRGAAGSLLANLKQIILHQGLVCC